MSENPSALSEPSISSGGDTSTRMGRMLDALARVPLPVVAAMLLLAGALVLVQQVWIDAIHSAGAEEPPQWVGRLTIMQVNILVPVALILLWSRRRRIQRRLGAVAAAMLLVLPVVHLVLTVAAIVWGGILGRGDLGSPMIEFEFLGLISYAGVFVSGLAWMLDRGAPRLIGPLIIVGFVVSFLSPWGMPIGYGLLAVVILTSGVARRTRVVPRISPVS